VGAEVGVWKGDFAATLLRETRPRRLHLIDPWRFLDDEAYSDAKYGGAEARDQADMDAIHRGVLRRFRWPRLRGVVKVHRAPSVEAAAELPDGSLDWVYIDGDHTYEGVRADIEAFRRKVKPGGLMLADDYGDRGWWADGVKRAFDEFIAAGGAEVVAKRRAQIVCRLPDARG
jgi:hypothetical protein